MLPCGMGIINIHGFIANDRYTLIHVELSLPSICTNFRGMQISVMAQIQQFHNFIFALENSWILCSFLISNTHDSTVALKVTLCDDEHVTTSM